MFHKLISKLLGRNLKSTPKDVIIDQMNESRPLPMGKADFEEWSDRIISGALIPGGEADKDWFIKNQKFVLAESVTHLSPTESHKPDAHFIHRLRKIAVNQVCMEYITEIKREQKTRQEAEEAAKKATDETTQG